MSSNPSAPVATPTPAAALAPTSANIADILKDRHMPAQPAPASFNHAMKNAKYYLNQYSLYTLTAEEETAVEARDDELWAVFLRASNAFATVGSKKANPQKYAELKAAKLTANKELMDFRKLSNPFKKDPHRYLQYYHGTPASKYVDGELTNYLIYRYYVWKLDGTDIYEELTANTPLGLLNPHAYFAARRQGEANFLDFLDKEQPAPRLPREDWPLAPCNLTTINSKSIKELANPGESDDEECAGCHFCDESIPAPAEKIPITPNSVIVVKSTFRAHSSGSENYSTRVFSSYESASKYIINQFREGGNAQMYWSEDDCFEERGYEKPMQEPTVEWACKQFNPAALKKFIYTPKFDNKLYGPYSEYCIHCPYELFIELCPVN